MRTKKVSVQDPHDELARGHFLARHGDGYAEDAEVEHEAIAVSADVDALAKTLAEVAAKALYEHPPDGVVEKLQKAIGPAIEEHRGGIKELLGRQYEAALAEATAAVEARITDTADSARVANRRWERLSQQLATSMRDIPPYPVVLDEDSFQGWIGRFENWKGALYRALRSV